MFKGIIYALVACFVWGLIFVVPRYMASFTAFEVALGRYFFYGMASLIIFLQYQLQGRCRYSKEIWNKALSFALMPTFGYYIFVVLAARYASPAICALIVGLGPITVAFYGNWKQKECNYKGLLWPSLLILTGLMVINIPQLNENGDPSKYCLGMFFAALALLSWTWYAVENARFLKLHPEMRSSDWSTLMGVATLVWTSFFGLITLLFFGDWIDFAKYFTWSEEMFAFLAGCAVLGFLCSWLGAYLWNKAAIYLPVSLAGQMLIFETIFGILFFYFIEQSLPPLWEVLGIALFLIAIIVGIKNYSLLPST